MARVRKGKGRKYDWMQTKLSFQDDVSASGSPHADSLYIDVARCLSLLNRKLVRQGHLFRIKGMRIYSDSNDTFRVKVTTLPTNWVVRNAWVKARALWNKMNAIAAEDAGGSTIYPKYHDFKVYMNAGHKSQGQTIIPVDADGNQVSTVGAEWVYSEYADSGSTSDNYDVKMLGAHDGTSTNYTCVGLIDAYRQSRVQPHSADPMLPGDILTSPWLKLFGDDDQTGDVVTNLNEDNDSPPYPGTIYIGDGADDGGFTVGTCTAGKPATAANITTIPSFVAPLGLIRVEIDDTADMSNVPIHISFDVDILGPMDM